MSEEKINVTAYSGYRGEEIPRTFMLGGNRIDVIEIQERWTEESTGDRATRRFFKIAGSDGRTHKIFYDEEREGWYYSE